MGGRRAHRPAPAQAPMELPPHVQQLLGPQSAALRDALSAPSPVSIRHNPLKQAAQLGLPVPWCAQGRYLEERPVFTLDPLLHAGAYYVQEASSMLLEQAVRACTGLPEEAVALDLCAAPGGKASHLAALLHPDALLVANEPVRSRQPALLENLWKWGRPGTVVTGADPAAFRPLGAFCDLVLVDAPCSGKACSGKILRPCPMGRPAGGKLRRTPAAHPGCCLGHAQARRLPGVQHLHLGDLRERGPSGAAAPLRCRGGAGPRWVPAGAWSVPCMACAAIRTGCAARASSWPCCASPAACRKGCPGPGAGPRPALRMPHAASGCARLQPGP